MESNVISKTLTLFVLDLSPQPWHCYVRAQSADAGFVCKFLLGAVDLILLTKRGSDFEWRTIRNWVRHPILGWPPVSRAMIYVFQFVSFCFLPRECVSEVTGLPAVLVGLHDVLVYRLVYPMMKAVLLLLRLLTLWLMWPTTLQNARHVKH